MSGMVFGNKFRVAAGQASPEDALSAASFPASGSFIDTEGTERVHCVIHTGAIQAADAPVFTLQGASAANGTLSDVDATNAKITLADTNDDEFVFMTVETAALGSSQRYITCTVSGTLVGSYADIFFLLEDNELPVTQASALVPSGSVLYVNS